MIIAQIKIRGARASIDWRKAITAGMIGAQVQMDYNDEIWDSLHKTVVFRGAITKDVITDAELVTIPAEVVAKQGVMLRVGVYGVDAENNIVIPTIWADLGIVRDSAQSSGDTTTDPSLPVWAQIEAKIGNLDDLNTTAKNNLVAAVNEAMAKGGGTVDETDVRRIVEEYLAANPPTVTESDPTVPAWAKQPTKPSYTATEVGALPDTYTPPIATETTLGGVKAAAATEDMTQPVGITADGQLVTVPSSDSGGNIDQSDSVFKGKTASFYGDSLTEVNGHYTKGYHSWVKDLLGLASYNNYGVSGYKVSDVYNKVNSVTDTADIIFVMCGVNDQTFSVPLGTMGDNTTGTTYGALNLLCALLKQKYPTSIVVFITPHYQTKYPHRSGITSYEVSKAIREVCEKYAIPVYDNFVLSGIYSTNLSTFTTDNCHWNDITHEMVGKNLAKFVTDSFRYVYDSDAGSGGGETGVTLTNISATYVGGDVTVGTAITELTGIVVTAHYSDGSTKTVTGYTLSGEIVEGENSITVSYGGKTTTFTVTGVSSPGESIVEVAMSDVGELVSISYLNDGRTAMYDSWETYNKKLEVSGYSSITGRFCCHYLPMVANVPYIVFFGKEDEVVGWEGLSTNVGESEKEDEKGGYGYSIERTFAIPDGAVTAALNGTTYFFDAYYNSGTYLLSRAK